ncbi:glycine/D-amino acid oxidase-like deaminating enzyme [Nocardia tenerifensis]|uniref:Glycine/D-amino acid oxidase-like deaminating enzyme n=1 Tax=Nocardia tenerifensis TaxID=228006 RepID=A0A318K112_9NOCA|nr:FAD-dependent oxidoreductase [Nocardia tenerifensis]PXX61671.1 glycine/D-amino acid oxidase-like deaminating enzyme [Nocardia tenerifensis]
MTSLWLDGAPATTYPTPEPGLRFDVVVVGGGLTGVTTALLLARGGASVALLEARTLGAVATGNTTAKLSLLQGTHVSTIAKKHSTETLRDYVAANREAQQWLLGFCADEGIDVQRAPAFTYAGKREGAAQVEAELAACRSAGLDVAWVDELDLPFPTYGAVRLDDQAQFDPVSVLRGLAAAAERHNAVIFENTRVTEVIGDEVRTEHGVIRAGTVVLATGTPILDRGGFFARLEPHRSYALAFETPGPIPHGMYLSADQPTRSLRYAPTPQGELLLVGGNGHIVGREKTTRSKVADLVDWTRKYWPGATLTHSWSAQDYSPIDGLPYVGPLVPGRDHILVATGYSKWGMTNGVAAALALSERIFGRQKDWAPTLEAWRTRELAGLGTALKANGGVGLAMVGGWARAELHGDGDAPAEGGGRVGRDGVRPVATCTVDGETTAVSAVCPHLYGIVQWNDAEKSWDCPLHGSRFAPDGRVLEGPATRPLSPAPRHS